MPEMEKCISLIIRKLKINQEVLVNTRRPVALTMTSCRQKLNFRGCK